MQLKKLIVSGFKSFADKVTLHFDDGITGIVGPNGSGKSNVIDAVRWVMGEQNAKHLRGEVATDIIFAGSDKRKPLGMAEVTLIFDNKAQSSFCPPEYRHEPEIAISRRLYIDGEREYFINKKPCRLKDIVGFFATTGLGGRSYSMIQQGQVDRILNAKPEDVREILEEAAGTLIFKARRLAAMKKLESTHENLKRIDDILSELHKQLESLREQVEKVAAWKELSHKIKDHELKLFSHNFRHFSSKLLELAHQLDQESDQEIKVLAEMSGLEARVEELQSQLADSDPELDGMREEISHLREQIVRAESTITAALKTGELGQKRLFELDQQMMEDQESLSSLENLVIQKEADYVRIQSELERLSDLISSFQDEVDQAEEASQVFQNRSQELEDEIKNLTLLLESNRLRCESIEKDRKRLWLEVQNQNSRAETLAQSLKITQEGLKTAREALSDKQAGLDAELIEKSEIEARLDEREQSIKQQSLERDKHKEQYIHTRSRLTALEELEAHSGDVKGSLQKLGQKHPEIKTWLLGSLTDMVSFQAEIQEWSPRAVSVLEKWCERLLFRDSEECSRFLRLHNQEPLGNFPVSILSLWQQHDLVPMQRWAESVDATSCLEVLKIRPDLATLLKPFLSRLYYYPSLDLSEQEWQTMPEGMIVFTAQGLVVQGRGEGQIAGATGKGSLSRKSELEELAQHFKESEVSLAAAQNLIDQLEAAQSVDRMRLKDLSDRLGNQNQEALSAMGEMQKLLSQEKHQLELIQQSEHQAQEIDQRESELKRELEQLGETRISLGQEKDTLQDEWQSLEEESSHLLDRKEEVMRVHQQRQLELAKLDTKAQSNRENLEQSRMQLSKLQTTVSRRYEEKQRIDSDLEQANIHQIQATQEIEVYIRRREELEEYVAVKREASAGVLEELRVIEGRLRESRDSQMDLQKIKSKKNVELERLKQLSRGLLDQAKEKYQIDLMNYEFVEDPQFDADKVQRELVKTRQQLEQMGGVNMVAVEEYERISQRHTFIESQKEEVLGSILLLEEAIDEIEETSKEKFLATFEVVNQNFTDLFPILFPGGEAKLELTSDDALLAGVEIMVRMPGKKPRSMNLYSGGEKALTAISLIFALLKTKPTPFCFLDEVDAPLDEANVGRYNRVLEALSSRFQFVVITHNRRTMEVLDQLYGVTMQEGGVSTVVGVDMKKDLPQHLQKAFKLPEEAKA